MPIDSVATCPRPISTSRSTAQCISTRTMARAKMMLLPISLWLSTHGQDPDGSCDGPDGPQWQGHVPRVWRRKPARVAWHLPPGRPGRQGCRKVGGSGGGGSSGSVVGLAVVLAVMISVVWVVWGVVFELLVLTAHSAQPVALCWLEVVTGALVVLV